MSALFPFAWTDCQTMASASPLDSAAAALVLAAAVALGLAVRCATAGLRDPEHAFAASPGVPSRASRFKALGAEPGQPLGGPMSEFFLNKDGLFVHFRRWVPQGNVDPLPPKGIVVIVHGLGEYSARYAHVAKALNRLGLVVYGLDHQGHGRSEGDRLYVKNFDDYVDDVMALVAIAKAENPLVANKTFILAHSMGGLIGISAIHKHQRQFAGAIISAPLLAIDPPVPPQGVAFWRRFSSVFPKLRGIGMQGDGVFKSLIIRNHYLNDPLASTERLPARLSYCIVTQTLKVMTEIAPAIRLPYLLIHGKNDGVCQPKASEMFHQLTQSDNKRIIFLDGNHETLNDSHDDILNQVIGWIKPLIA